MLRYTYIACLVWDRIRDTTTEISYAPDATCSCFKAQTRTSCSKNATTWLAALHMARACRYRQPTRPTVSIHYHGLEISSNPSSLPHSTLKRSSCGLEWKKEIKIKGWEGRMGYRIAKEHAATTHALTTSFHPLSHTKKIQSCPPPTPSKPLA